jgi:hypothetical protein
MVHPIIIQDIKDGELQLHNHNGAATIQQPNKPKDMEVMVFFLIEYF